MYPDLYKGLKLRSEDLMPYTSPLMSFDEKTVMPKGQIRLPVIWPFGMTVFPSKLIKGEV